ncbi:MAG: hypothetical protein KC422_17670 [Trueperaceae bacterium]|nr:hypothetical protein [Trueperaceae bacterium]
MAKTANLDKAEALISLFESYGLRVRMRLAEPKPDFAEKTSSEAEDRALATGPSEAEATESSEALVEEGSSEAETTGPSEAKVKASPIEQEEQVLGPSEQKREEGLSEEPEPLPVMSESVLALPETKPKLAVWGSVFLLLCCVGLLTYFGSGKAFQLDLTDLKPPAWLYPPMPQRVSKTAKAKPSLSYELIGSKDISYWVVQREINYVALSGYPLYGEIDRLARRICLERLAQLPQLDGLILYLYGPKDLSGARAELAKVEWRYMGPPSTIAEVALRDEHLNYALTSETLSEKDYLLMTLGKVSLEQGF